MSDLTGIPCISMRGGTSRGPYFKTGDLPGDRATRDRVLLAVMGSPDARADRRPRRRGHADQQGRDRLEVGAPRRRPRLSVRPGRHQQGNGRHHSPLRQHAVRRRALRPGDRHGRGTDDGKTRAMIYDVNTQSPKIEAIVQTPGRKVNWYTGDTASTARRAPRRRFYSTSWTWSARAPANCCRPAR